MVREELIDGAISFLQDPSVASAPVEQKIAFLRSKNLTQDEVDTSLARVGQPQQAPASQPQSYPPQQQQHRQQPASQQYQNYAYQQQQQPPPYWQQPPPEPLRRDWRDYFIMATLVGGVGYGVWWTAKRYIVPLIAPPTPPQLEQDKQHIDSSFDKAFALLDQLATDTAELKASETARSQRLDAALAEVEGVIGRMKEANAEREREARGMARELGEVREQIPRALEKERGRWEAKLEELGGEMRSLKALVGGRLQQQQQAQANSQAHVQRASQPATAPVLNGTPAPPAATPTSDINGTSTNSAPSSTASTQTPTDAAAATPERPVSASPYGRKLGGKAQIPSWQLAAKKRSEEQAQAKKEEGDSSGAATPAVEGKPAEVADEVVADS